ncbi:MAG: hypothetical protein CEE38_17380 [Planctomycetes bacterium B3_Pla]|nr:MAG: hypothetical protein CEE38_17380 [Planctomycetes bacterium B3_Pla]
MMNFKRGFKRITFALATLAALSGTVIGVSIVINEYEYYGGGYYTPNTYKGYGGVYIGSDNIESQDELTSDLLSTPGLVGLCVAAGLAGGLAGFSSLWFSGLAIYKFIKWLILGFCEDVNSKQAEGIEAKRKSVIGEST